MRRKDFQFLIADEDEFVDTNCWYRRSHWDSPNFLIMDTEWDAGWKCFSKEEEVVGVTHEGRDKSFLVMGDAPDFRVFLQREPDNRYDPNAIKVMGVATIKGRQVIEQLGYLSRETAQTLRGEAELDARPRAVWLPHGNCSYGLRITVLVRSKAYKKALYQPEVSPRKANRRTRADAELEPVTATAVPDEGQPPRPSIVVKAIRAGVPVVASAVRTGAPVVARAVVDTARSLPGAWRRTWAALKKFNERMCK